MRSDKVLVGLQYVAKKSFAFACELLRWERPETHKGHGSKHIEFQDMIKAQTYLPCLRRVGACRSVTCLFYA